MLLDPKREILLVSVPMIFFVEFVGDLQSILEAIHTKTKAVFIPIAI